MRTFATLTALTVFAVTASGSVLRRDGVQTACSQLSSQLSSASGVFSPGSANYNADVKHWLDSSSAAAVCSVEPGSVADLGKTLTILGANKAAFGVKGGGHATNPGFSSSTGVQIAMTRFNNVDYHSNNQTVDIGTGLVWDDVYSKLDAIGISVAGGRVTGVGVAGFTLGGGLSYFGNEVGFSVDNLVNVQLVLPNGTFVNANANTNSDLFFGVKGGWNNFGIVTQVTYKAIQIPNLVWGGTKVVPGENLADAQAAINKYITTVTDPKASLWTMFAMSPGDTAPATVFGCFYDGPSPAAGTFDDIIALPANPNNVTGPRGLTGIAQSVNFNLPSNRGSYNTAAIEKATPAIVEAAINQTIKWNQILSETSSSYVAAIVGVEPFLPNLFTQAAQGSSAYPPSRANPFSPLVITMQWNSTSEDSIFNNATNQISQAMSAAAKADGQDLSTVPVYGNYASPASYTSQDIFSNSLPELQTIKAKYDPGNVMGLTGGWKVTV